MSCVISQAVKAPVAQAASEIPAAKEETTGDTMIKKIVLRDDEMPLQWYNVVPDLPGGLQPPLDPETKEPMGPEKLSAIFPMGLLEQEMSDKRFIDIPEEVLDILKIWRPSPLVRATSLEKALNTKAKIFFKNEGVSPVGSHKPNTAVAQAYYNHREGIKRLATETGAGQWGSALSLATNKFGMECKVYMVRISFDQKPYRKSVMHTYGATVIPSPSNETNTGRAILEQMPDTPGSLGIAISEAIEDAATREDTNYCTWFGAEPCHSASVDHRPGGQEADGNRRGIPRCDHRLLRRRLQLRRNSGAVRTRLP